MGKRSNQVRFVDEEIRLLKTFFELFVGDDPRGPLRPESMAALLDAEGHRWPEDLLQSTEEYDTTSGDRIVGWRIRDALQNPRYNGMERSKHGDYPCAAFLRD